MIASWRFYLLATHIFEFHFYFRLPDELDLFRPCELFGEEKDRDLDLSFSFSRSCSFSFLPFRDLESDLDLDLDLDDDPFLFFLFERDDSACLSSHFICRPFSVFPSIFSRARERLGSFRNETILKSRIFNTDGVYLASLGNLYERQVSKALIAKVKKSVKAFGHRKLK